MSYYKFIDIRAFVFYKIDVYNNYYRVYNNS